MRDVGNHHEHIAKCIDDKQIILKDTMSILNQMRKLKRPYNFKGVGSTEYYLGGDVKIEYCGDSITGLSLSAKTYILHICKNHNFNWLEVKRMQ